MELVLQRTANRGIVKCIIAYSNRAVRAFFRRNPPQEGKVAPLLKRRPMQVGRNAVVYRRNIICQRQRFALVVRD